MGLRFTRSITLLGQGPSVGLKIYFQLNQSEYEIDILEIDSNILRKSLCQRLPQSPGFVF